MKAIQDLTEMQLKLLNHLWDSGGMTINSLLERLQKERDISRSTVATVIARLEKQGIVSHRDEGGGFVYFPLVSRDRVRAERLGFLVDSVFGGKISEVVSHLFVQPTKSSELEEAMRLIKQHEERGEDHD